MMHRRGALIEVMCSITSKDHPGSPVNERSYQLCALPTGWQPGPFAAASRVAMSDPSIDVTVDGS